MSRLGSSPLPAPADPFAVPARWLCALLFAATLLVYWPTLGGGLLWDDAGHLTRPDLRSLDGLRRIWFEIGATQQYYPLLHSAFWIEHRLWGDATVGYHVINVLQHATAACLFAAVLRRLSLPGSALAALLFALHPVCVESVAWISEQKNTLSALFYLASALAFLKWHGLPARDAAVAAPSRLVAGVADPGPGLAEPGYNSAPTLVWKRGRPRPQVWYALATFLFLCALLTKTVTATLPAALLVVLWWRHGRLEWRRDVMPLLPWFALSLAGGTLTAYFERALIGAEGSDFDLSLLERGLLASRVPWFYLGKLLWPADLVFIYPRWNIDAAAGWQWLFPVATLSALFLAWRLARSDSRTSRMVGAAPSSVAPRGARGPEHVERTSDAPARPGLSALRPSRWTLSSRLSSRARRAPLAAALLFGGTLFPVLGFFNVYPFLFSYAADHFQYLASLAVFALLSATLAAALTRVSRTAARASAAALLLVLGALSWSQAGTYGDVVTLYRTTLARNPSASLAHNNLAVELSNSGQLTEAVSHLERALQLRPDYVHALGNLGDILVQLGRPAEALPHLERAIRLQARFAEAHNSLGTALLALGRREEALQRFHDAIHADPRLAPAHYNVGLILATADRPAEAIPHFARAIELRPHYADAELSWGIALMSTGRFDEAVSHFERAIALNPDSPAPHQTYGRALAQHGRLHEALAHFRRAVEVAPHSAPAHLDLAHALRQLGRADEAQPHYIEARRLGTP